MILEAIKPLQGGGSQQLYYHNCSGLITTRWSGQVWVWALAWHLAISPKSVPEGNQRFRGQNQLPSSWGSSLALLAQVGLASTNTGCFRVCGSSSWRLALSRKIWNMLPLLLTWLSSKVKKVLMLCKFLAATSHFFLSKISMGCNKFLPTKELPNASEVHSIFLLVVGLSVKYDAKQQV